MKMEAKPAQVLDEMDKSKAAEVLKIMNASPSGLKWTNVGEAKPNVGRELSNSKLAKALESKQTWLASKKEDKDKKINGGRTPRNFNAVTGNQEKPTDQAKLKERQTAYGPCPACGKGHTFKGRNG